MSTTPETVSALGEEASRLYMQYLCKSLDFANALRQLADVELPAPWKWAAQIGWYDSTDQLIVVSPSKQSQNIIATLSDREKGEWRDRLRAFLDKHKVVGLQLHGIMNPP
jgi:hypothetical protein